MKMQKGRKESIVCYWVLKGIGFMLLGFEGDCFCNFTVLYEIRFSFLVFGEFGKDRCTADSP